MEFLNGVNKIIDSKYGRFEFWVVFLFPFLTGFAGQRTDFMKIGGKKKLNNKLHRFNL